MANIIHTIDYIYIIKIKYILNNILNKNIKYLNY